MSGGHPKIPEEDLLDALRELADELGRPPTGDEMADQGEYPSRTYEWRFGNWGNALEAAGLERRPQGVTVTPGYHYTDDELLGELLRVGRELGWTPTTEEMDEYGQHHVDTYKDRFGSWGNALNAIGLPPNQVTSEDTDEYDTRIYRGLLVFGPTPRGTLPHHPTTTDKSLGVTYFTHKSRQHAESVYYIDGRYSHDGQGHDIREVIAVWLDANFENGRPNPDLAKRLVDKARMNTQKFIYKSLQEELEERLDISIGR